MKRLPGRPRRLAQPPKRATPQGAQAAIASGSIGWGAGGPGWLDQFRTKRAPIPPELAEQFKSVAYACVQLNAWGTAQVPLRLYLRTVPRDPKPRRYCVDVPPRRLEYFRRLNSTRRAMLGADNVQEVVEHPWVEALEAPNDHFDGAQFVYYLAACLDVFGRFYIYPENRLDRTWASRTWWPLQPQYVLPQKAEGKILGKYTYFGETFAPDELEGGRFLSLRDPYLSGYAPLHACYEQLGLYNYYQATVENLFKGGARPSGLVGPKDSMQIWEPDQRARIEQDIANDYEGGNQGRIWVVDGSYTFTALSYPPVDLGGEEIAKSVRLTAANCFSVPISLLQTEDSNRAVAEAGNFQHQRTAIRPRCVSIAAALTKMARAVDPRYFFAFDNPVDRDEVSKAKIWDMKIRNTSALINEARADDGLPPVEWGDEPFKTGPAAEPGEDEKAKDQGKSKAKTKDGESKAKPDADEEPKDDEERKFLSTATRVLETLEREAIDRAGDRRRSVGGRGKRVPGRAE
jgi:phage portal protein BeeE